MGLADDLRPNLDAIEKEVGEANAAKVAVGNARQAVTDAEVQLAAAQETVTKELGEATASIDELITTLRELRDGLASTS